MKILHHPTQAQIKQIECIENIYMVVTHI